LTRATSASYPYTTLFRSRPYLGLLRADLALNDKAAALATAERNRARSLVDLLAERRLDFRAGAPEELLHRQDELDRKRAAAYAEDRKSTRLNSSHFVISY